MRLSVGNIPQVVLAYIEEDLLPKANPLQKLASVFIGTAVARQAEFWVKSNEKLFRNIELLDDEGIDLDATKDLAIEAFEKSGPVEILGVILNKDDVTTIYNIAKKYSK